jgi:type 1 glutamine amidotransferase
MMRAIALFVWALAAWAQPVRVELVTGGHSHELSFYSVFEGNPEFRVNVNPHPLAFTGDMRKGVDVLVLYDMVDVNEEPRRKNLRDFLEAGKGLVVLHHAVIDNQQWPWWYEEITGGRYFLNAEGSQRASTYQHDVPLKVRAPAKHSITAGLEDFAITDEVYNFMWRSPKTQVLLEADRPEGEKAVAWIGPWEKSRVVVIQLGHGKEAHENASYRKLVRNAILWSAGRLR